MTSHQKVFAIICSLIIFLTIIFLVKRGKLKEEFTWVWFLIGCMILGLVLWYDLLLFFSSVIGAATPTTTLFIFGIVFLLIICLHFAIKISHLTDQVKNLVQKVSLLEARQREMG